MAHGKNGQHGGQQRMPTPEAILREHSFKLTLILATLTFFRIVFPHFFLFQPGGGGGLCELKRRTFVSLSEFEHEDCVDS